MSFKKEKWKERSIICCGILKNTLKSEDNRIHKNTWSQSSSSIVPLMFLKNSVSWLPLFLSASDAATPAYMSTAKQIEHKSTVSSNTRVIQEKYWRKLWVWEVPGRLNSWITWKAKSKFLSARVSAISHLLLHFNKYKYLTKSPVICYLTYQHSIQKELLFYGIRASTILI